MQELEIGVLVCSGECFKHLMGLTLLQRLSLAGRITLTHQVCMNYATHCPTMSHNIECGNIGC